jgi:hypothetical protein
MSNFGSRQLGFFTSKGSSGGGYQNLQQTLDYGNITTNDLLINDEGIKKRKSYIVNRASLIRWKTDLSPLSTTSGARSDELTYWRH